MSVPYILTDSSASIFLDFVPHTIHSSHPNWQTIIGKLADADTTENDLMPLLDVAKSVSTYMNGFVEYRDRAIYFDGRPIDNSLTRRIIQHMSAGDEAFAAPLIEFLKKVMENPSRRAVQGLYEWVEKSGLPITSDGYVLAWKILREDFTDIHTGKFDNSVGKRVEIPRNQVDEDPDQTCSHGLHVCSTGYLPNYGGFYGSTTSPVVVVKIHPKDFVAVPRDYNVSKARVCGYDVIAQVAPDKASEFFPNAFVYDEPEPEPELTPEVGDVWKCHTGCIVKVVSVDNEADDWDEFAIVARVIVGTTDHPAGSHMVFTKSGKFLNYQDSPEDLAVLCPDYEPYNLEVGRTYLTRDNRIVEIEASSFTVTTSG